MHHPPGIMGPRILVYLATSQETLPMGKNTISVGLPPLVIQLLRDKVPGQSRN
jgi:hypothetical protein